MEKREFRGKTVEEALTQATIELGVTSDRLEYDVVEKGSSGFLGIGSKNAVILVGVREEKSEEEATVISTSDPVAEEKPMAEPVRAEAVPAKEEVVADKREPEEEAEPVDPEEVISRAKEFLSSVFDAMNLEVELKIDYEEDGRMLSIEMSGPEMGIIIGKRGQTLDSLQYLTNLAVNRKLASYVRVKMDTEDYRRRRKSTLENLARNVAYKVKRMKRPVSLEPMNPYERRVIHYALQHDSYVKTESEGEEPYRHVVVSLK